MCTKLVIRGLGLSEKPVEWVRRRGPIQSQRSSGMRDSKKAWQVAANEAGRELEECCIPEEEESRGKYFVGFVVFLFVCFVCFF